MHVQSHPTISQPRNLPIFYRSRAISAAADAGCLQIEIIFRHFRQCASHRRVAPPLGSGQTEGDGAVS